MAQPSNWRPIYTKSQYLPPIGQYSDFEDQNRLEATSHQKLAADGASPKLIPTHTESLYFFHHDLDQLTRAGPTHHPSTWHGGGGGQRFSSFAQNSARTRLELYAILLVNITRPLIQSLYEFLDPNLGLKRDWDNFILKHADSDIAILGEFRPKSAGKRFKSLNRPHLTFFPASL